MSRLSMNELTTFRWSFEEDVLRYRHAGYQAMGVWRRKLADFGEERAVELLSESGMSVSNLLWAGGVTGNDGRSLRESVSDARAAIRTAATLGAEHLVFYTGGRNNHTQRHARRLILGALEGLIPFAEEHGVTIAIEPMHPSCCSEWSILTSLQECLELLAEVDNPYVRLVYDTYHFPFDEAAGRDELELLTQIAPSIALVQLGDWSVPHGVDQQRCALGQGKVPLKEIIAALLEGGYDGDFDVELIGAANDADEYEQLLHSSKQFYLEAVATVGATPH